MVLMQHTTILSILLVTLISGVSYYVSEDGVMRVIVFIVLFATLVPFTRWVLDRFEKETSEDN